ncbi:MAG: DNA polymerase IV [Nitrospinaceae bacterium]|nr:MAG: DNA polymerase IV [Nitrospinaceae bacterium]
MHFKTQENLAAPREILHVDMDAFFVSVEEALNPSLKGKPVIVGGDPAGRGVVAAASYAARRFGVHSAMPLGRARRLCPDAIFLRGSHGVYSEFSRRIFRLLGKYSPEVEPLSLDEAYLDLTGCARLHGPVLPTAERILNEIRSKVGINASTGIASNKLLAKVASAMAKPSGLLWIAPGMEGRFLAPLPVDRLPGIGPKSGERFRRLGVRTVGHLAQLPLELLQEVYGQWGDKIHLRARGICQSPVVGQADDARSISREITFETDSIDPAFLKATLSYLSEKATAKLRAQGLYARSVTLKLRYSDFRTVTRSHTLDEATARDADVISTALGLLDRLLKGRTRVRLIGIALSSLTRSPSLQASLFADPSPEKWDRLYQGIDRIRHKYGFRSILRAASVPRD